MHSFSIQDHRGTRGLLISQNHLYGQPVLTFDKRQICEEILKELRFNVIKNLLSFTAFFINGFITMCNLIKKRLIRLAFWVLLRAMFMNAWKQTAKRWKLHFWDYQKSTKKNNSIEHLQRQQFSFTKTNEYLSVSKNPQVVTSKPTKVYVLSRRFPGVGCFQRWTHEKKTLQSFLSTAKIITKYSLESFFFLFKVN